MLIIQHRINTSAQLQQVPKEYGVELDVRSKGSQLIIHHEPFLGGENLEDWLQHYDHSFIIFNVKEEGLEDSITSLINKYKIKDFFFLDQSFPFLIKTSKTGEKRCAVRVSEFESLETALSLSSKINWVWIDYFTKFPLSSEDATKLKNASFKLCLVSPELQGYKDADVTHAVKAELQKKNIIIDAVCTKTPANWI